MLEETWLASGDPEVLEELIVQRTAESE